jgi:hypothetical protein
MWYTVYLMGKEARYCETCGRGTWACVCGLSFRERIRTFQVSYKNFDTRTLRNYWDSGAIDSQFGEDSEERYLEETKNKDIRYLLSGPEYEVDL